MSVPEPPPIPISATAKAGASLIRHRPSQRFALALQILDSLRFWSGRTSLMTVLIPACLAIACVFCYYPLLTKPHQCPCFVILQRSLYCLLLANPPRLSHLVVVDSPRCKLESDLLCRSQHRSLTCTQSTCNSSINLRLPI